MRYAMENVGRISFDEFTNEIQLSERLKWKSKEKENIKWIEMRDEMVSNGREHKKWIEIEFVWHFPNQKGLKAHIFER